jgi:glycosyltransferase 2 family protein
MTIEGAKGSHAPTVSASHVIIGIGVSAMCLVIAFRQVDLSSFTAALRSADYRWLWLYVPLCVALNVVRAEVWSVLLKRRAERLPAFWAYGVGFLFNNVLPFRMGEAARVVVLARHEHIPTAEVAATAILERLLDLMAVLVVLVCTLPIVGLGDGALRWGALSAASAIAVALTGIAILALWGDACEAFISNIAAIVGTDARDAIVRRWQQAVDGASRLLQPRIGVPAAIGILLVWAMTVLAQWTVLRAFQPGAGLADAAFMVAVVSLAIAVPAAPGFVGVYQWAGQQALVHAFPGIYTPASGLAIAVVAHAASYICSSLLGMLGLWYFGSSFALVSRVRSEPELADLETR